MAPAYEQRLEAALASRLERGMLRSIDPRPKEQQKANLVDFSSNDYISFGRSRRLRQKLVSSLEEKESLPVYGPPSSRLLDGNSPLHAALELRLAAFFRAPTALLFNSGFDANVGLWTCLADQRDWIVYDRLVHASMHDGMRSSRVPASRRRAFAHNSVRNLSELLGEIVRSDEGVRDGTRSVWIGVESLYSMDGDLAPLEEIVQAVEAALPRGNGHIIVDEVRSSLLHILAARASFSRPPISLTSRHLRSRAGPLDGIVRPQRPRTGLRARTGGPRLGPRPHLWESHGLQRR